MKYKVGDKVKIRENLDSSEKYGNWDCSYNMASCSGMIATIIRCNDDSYQIDVDDGIYNWSDEMFEDKDNAVVESESESESESNIRAKNVDIGFYLEYCGHRVIENVCYGGYAHDHNHIFCTTADAKNQYVLPFDSIEFVIPHEVD